MREEAAIFRDLSAVCTSSGYVHALASLCFRDTVVEYSDGMSAESMDHLYSMERLIRTERSTLIGLMVQQEIGWSQPDPKTVKLLIDETERLLKELHESMSSPTMTELAEALQSGRRVDALKKGKHLREPIFYCGESAYSFQFRELSVAKYQADDPWLQEHKGFTIRAARDVVQALVKIQNRNFTSVAPEVAGRRPEEWVVLPCFIFTTKELAEASGLDRDLIERVVEAFVLPAHEGNMTFRAVDDFNLISALPIIPVGDGRLLLLEQYGLQQSLYESPFFWMWEDLAYRNTALVHRGNFVEDFCEARLRSVFGNQAVFSNVRIPKAKGKDAGEIDTLVLFGDRAIVVQAKAKRLTLEARKGNDNLIRDDFTKSVQNACNQALSCARALARRKGPLIASDGTRIDVPNDLREIYILCAVSEHYPALSIQVRQFLNYETDAAVVAPFILDVFTLDVMAEMLETPLLFLSYIKRRASYQEKLYVSHELITLSYHLKFNLWFEKQYDIVQLGDDIAAELEIAMMVRREGAPGPHTPDGILARFKSTSVGDIVREIESRPGPHTMDLGFALLTLPEDAVIRLSNAIDAMIRQTAGDGRHHDVAMPMGESGDGLTVHCNLDPAHIAGARLETHCLLRKYKARAGRWYGICLAPDASLRFGINLEAAWEPNARMKEMVSAYLGHGSSASKLAPDQARPKVGRNDLCPCRSGRKFKKCCLL
jgi:hypothetical protein